MLRRDALSTDAQPKRQPAPVDCPRRKAAIMSKPVKTEAELIAMARAELKAHLDCPDDGDQDRRALRRRLLGIPRRGR
jgi:hypothetical protein